MDSPFDDVEMLIRDTSHSPQAESRLRMGIERKKDGSRGIPAMWLQEMELG